MAAVADAFSSAFRDFVTDGVPASGPNKPYKAEARGLGAIIEASLGSIGLADVDLTKDTRAHLNADLAWAVDSVALVYADSTDANNDLYIKVGASGTGSWTLTGILHGIISGLAASQVAAQVAAQVDPLVASATASATLAGHFANDSTDVAVPGQGDSTARGAKFWSLSGIAGATLAGHYANDSTDVQVPGQGDTTARGAKYWSLQAAALASGQTIGLVLPSLPVPADIFAEFSGSKYYFQGYSYVVFASWLAGVSGSFTRAGPSTYINSVGLRVAGTVNAPRTTFNPVTLAPLGLLYEPLATQIFTNTDDITTATWAFVTTGVTRTAAAATGPDGTTSAGFLKQTATTGLHDMWYREGAATITSGLFYAFQVWMKPAGTTKIKVSPFSGMGLGAAVTVDFTAQTVTGTGWTLEAWQNGWFRLWKSSTATGTGTSDMHFYLLDAGGSDTFTGDNTSGVYFGGIQYEQTASAGLPPTSYIPRVTATATRAADALSFTIPAGVTKLTYTLGDGTLAPVVTVSAGAYTVPTTLSQTAIKSLITVDLGVVGVAVTSVAGKTGAVVLAQADIAGLTVASSPTFAGLNITAESIALGGSILKNISATNTFQWTTGATARTDRCVLIGAAAANSVTSAFQNSGPIIGNDALKNTITLATSVVLGDTAGGSSPLVSGSNLLGNEAGNGPSISGSNIIGNLSRCGYTGATVTRCDVMGQSAMLNNGCVDTVAIGQSVGLGINPTAGSTINQSVMIGSQVGKLSGGATITGLILIGYNIQAPTATTSNYISLGNVVTYLGSSSTVTIQTPAAGKAKLVLKGLAASTSYANDAAAAAGGVAIDEVYRNGSVVQVRVT